VAYEVRGEAVTLENEIKNALKSGKVVLGTKQTLKLLKLGKLKVVVMAKTAPPDVVSDVNYYAKLSNVPVLIFSGNSYDLGLLCGKPFPVTLLGVIDLGESRLLELVKGEEEGGK